jgi:phosphoribosylamine--glycine ligase
MPLPAGPGRHAAPRLLHAPPKVVDFCKKEGIGLVMVGPEAPLVAGLVDALDAAGVRAFGPSAAAAQLEGSKKFMKVRARGVGLAQVSGQAWQCMAEALAMQLEPRTGCASWANVLATSSGRH